MPLTNASLLLRLRRDADPASWAEFVELYEPLLRQYVAGCGVRACDAPDIVQEIFLRLLKCLPEFEYSSDRGRFRHWLRRVTRNAVADWMRRQRRYGRCDLPDDAASSPDDSGDWDRAHRLHVLSHALQSLRREVSSAAWQCFEQYVLLGQPADQVARQSGLSRAALYVIASRLRGELRRKCAQFDEDL